MYPTLAGSLPSRSSIIQMCKQENLWTRWQNDSRAACHPCAPILRAAGPTECHSSSPQGLLRALHERFLISVSSDFILPHNSSCGPNTCCLFFPQRTVGATETATHDRHTANVESELPPQLRGSVPGTSEFSTGFVGTSGLDPRWVLRLRRGSCSHLMRPQARDGAGSRRSRAEVR